jgi:DNA polymerase-3 subunit beta
LKFTIERNAFAKALSRTTRVVERRNTYPILANVLLSADMDGRLTIRATDLDIEITESIPAVVSAAGQTTVPASMLADIVRKFPDGSEVSFAFDHESNNATIKAGRSRFNLATLAPDSFPDLKHGTFQHTFSLATADLARLLSKVSFAISNEETRYYLNGIYFHKPANEDLLRGVATDGHRMARYDLPLPSGAGGIPGVIIPKKTVAEVAKLLGDADGEVTIEMSDTKIRFAIGGVHLLSKLIEGTFPDYQRVTPALSNTVATVDAADLKSAIDRVSIVSSDRGGKAVKFGLSAGKLLLEVTNPDHGTSQEDMPADWGGEAFDIGYNARYALDVINALDGKQIKFSLTDAGAPTRIFSDDDPNALLVLMPMRV